MLYTEDMKVERVRAAGTSTQLNRTLSAAEAAAQSKTSISSPKSVYSSHAVSSPVISERPESSERVKLHDCCDYCKKNLQKKGNYYHYLKKLFHNK
jgi:hypothetical protein